MSDELKSREITRTVTDSGKTRVLFNLPNGRAAHITFLPSRLTEGVARLLGDAAAERFKRKDE